MSAATLWIRDDVADKAFLGCRGLRRSLHPILMVSHPRPATTQVCDFDFFLSPEAVKLSDYMVSTYGIYRFRWGDALLRYMTLSLLATPDQVRVRTQLVSYSRGETVWLVSGTQNRISTPAPPLRSCISASRTATPENAATLPECVCLGAERRRRRREAGGQEAWNGAKEGVC